MKMPELMPTLRMPSSAVRMGVKTLSKPNFSQRLCASQMGMGQTRPTRIIQGMKPYCVPGL